MSTTLTTLPGLRRNLADLLLRRKELTDTTEERRRDMYRAGPGGPQEVEGVRRAYDEAFDGLKALDQEINAAGAEIRRLEAEMRQETYHGAIATLGARENAAIAQINAIGDQCQKFWREVLQPELDRLRPLVATAREARNTAVASAGESGNPRPTVDRIRDSGWESRPGLIAVTETLQWFGERDRAQRKIHGREAEAPAGA